eukprot:GFYU01028541.1.p1 GENE.GFYU01028541.1~~GFYU01028541.1.p1  ORF type:complete len:214 (+),score=26.61 GFYU01028541.1:30-671(+)
MSVQYMLVSTVATFTSASLYLSPLPNVNEIWRNGSAGNFSVFPFQCMFLNALLGFLYGDLVSNSTIMVVNGFGVGCGVYYLYVFHDVAKDKEPVERGFVVLLFIIMSFITYVFYAVPAMDAALHAGTITSCVCIIMFGSPLAKVFTVIQNRTTDGLSFNLSAVTVANTLLWILLGLMVRDPFIVVPNFLGLLLGLMQLALFWMYPASAKPVEY